MLLKRFIGFCVPFELPVGVELAIKGDGPSKEIDPTNNVGKNGKSLNHCSKG